MVFHKLSKNLNNELYVAQNGCMRLIYNLNWRSETTPYRKEFNWLKNGVNTLLERQCMKLLKMMNQKIRLSNLIREET